MKGRKKVPTALNLLRGNPGKRPLPECEPVLTACLPPCPAHLSDRAKAAWESFGRQLADAGILTELDAVALELLCNAYAGYLDAQENLLKFGAVLFIPSKDNSKIPTFAYSPWWAVANREWDKLLKMLPLFGMNPADRTKIKTVNKAEPDELEIYLAEAE